MKSLSFNQLQLRIFVLIFILFTSAVVSYRVFIEHPKLEKNVLNVLQKELQILNYSAKNYLKSLTAINYDYAVWDQSYQFVEDLNQSYISENLIDDTFVSLSIDGIVIFKENHDVAFAKGFHHTKEESLVFNFFDFALFPENEQIFPPRSANKKVAHAFGMLNTQFGPALYSITEIKRSDRSGDNRGFILFLKLFSNEIIDEIEQYTMTDIVVTPVGNDKALESLVNWTDSITLEKVSPVTHLYILDIHQKPLFKLSMQHSIGEMPAIIDKQSLIFISLFTLVIFIVYSLISQIIIRPVRLLARQIQGIDENESAKFLDDNYRIKELDNVSLHFNQLMATIARQKALLNQQVYTDTLTGITNRRGFEQHLEKQCQHFIRHNITFTVIVADVDHFKRYNDSLGHIAGDEALVSVAQTLNQHFKRSNDLCARYGGEEFVMIYSDISREDLEQKLDQILLSFSQLNLPHPSSNSAPYVTTSLGACIVNSSLELEKELSPKDVIRAADFALYQAKNNGRNCFMIIDFKDFTPSDN